MKTGDNIEFNQSKNFKFVRELGSGGTGVTNLFKDETTNTLFAIKKYQPVEGNIEHREEFYHRFVDEIKILFKLSHPNIVRVYNYYLYPNYMLGYLQMEYIEGVAIDSYVKNNTINLDKLFRSAVSAFECLEENNILHRDIRPSNILIDNEGELKIIDFGFGKVLEKDNVQNSIILNWPATEFPNEVINNHAYTVQTEVYFLGYLFKKLIRENNIKNFRFLNILDKMCATDANKRYESFEGISGDIAKGVILSTEFSSIEKNFFQIIANSLSKVINYNINNFSPKTDLVQIQEALESAIKKCALEEYIQDNSTFIDCFLENAYSYTNRKIIRVDDVKNFYKLLLNSDADRKGIILENLKTRLNLINVVNESFDISDDDLPF